MTTYDDIGVHLNKGVGLCVSLISQCVCLNVLFFMTLSLCCFIQFAGWMRVGLMLEHRSTALLFMCPVAF